MSSVKRKIPPASLLQRRVRPRYEPEPESDIEDDASEAPSEEGAGSFGSDDEEAQDLSEDESGSGSGEVSLKEDLLSNGNILSLDRAVPMRNQAPQRTKTRRRKMGPLKSTPQSCPSAPWPKPKQP
jgi:hypothetical protein